MSSRRTVLMTSTGHCQIRTGSGTVFLEKNSRFVFYQHDEDEVGESKRTREAERREEVRTRIDVYKTRSAYRALIVPIYLANAPPPPRTACAAGFPRAPVTMMNSQRGAERSRDLREVAPGQLASGSAVQCGRWNHRVVHPASAGSVRRNRKSFPNGGSNSPFLVDATID